MEPNLNLDSALNSVKHDEFNKFNAITSKNRRGGKKMIIQNLVAGA